MNASYLKRVSEHLRRIRPRLGATHKLEFRSCFGAVAGYIDGNIFISCGRFGTALKLPPEAVASLLTERGVKRLKYFPNGHVKKDYAVLPRRLLEDEIRMKKLLLQSVRFAQNSK